MQLDREYGDEFEEDEGIDDDDYSGEEEEDYSDTAQLSPKLEAYRERRHSISFLSLFLSLYIYIFIYFFMYYFYICCVYLLFY